MNQGGNTFHKKVPSESDFFNHGTLKLYMYIKGKEIKKSVEQTFFLKSFI